MTRHFDIVIECDSDGYLVGSVPALPRRHTQARSLDDLTTRMREAIVLCIEEQGVPSAELDFIGVQRIAVEA